MGSLEDPVTALLPLHPLTQSSLRLQCIYFMRMRACLRYGARSATGQPPVCEEPTVGMAHGLAPCPHANHQVVYIDGWSYHASASA